jgi:hypothetical protein
MPARALFHTAPRCVEIRELPTPRLIEIYRKKAKHTSRRYVPICLLGAGLALAAEGASWRTNPLRWGSGAHEAP